MKKLCLCVKIFNIKCSKISESSGDLFSYLRKNKFFHLKSSIFWWKWFWCRWSYDRLGFTEIAFISYFTTKFIIYNEDKCVQNQFKNYTILSKIKSLINSKDEYFLVKLIYKIENLNQLLIEKLIFSFEIVSKL